jgi:DNA-binding transcriptional regulator YhcF (GntR family)
MLYRFCEGLWHLIEQTDILIDVSSDIPIWFQIAAVLSGQVSKRLIKVGEFTCSVRYVARLNNLSVTAVAKAYENLREKEILVSDPKRGYKIGSKISFYREKILRQKIQELKLTAKQLKITKKEIIVQLDL